MPNRTRMFIKPLVLAMLALPFAQNLFAAEECKTPSPAVEQSQHLADFLDSLADPPSPGEESLTPAPANKVAYCTYQPCPTGQRCWYCNRNWICLWEYPDPDYVPAGCSGGGPL